MCVGGICTGGFTQQCAQSRGTRVVQDTVVVTSPAFRLVVTGFRHGSAKHSKGWSAWDEACNGVSVVDSTMLHSRTCVSGTKPVMTSLIRVQAG